MRSCPASPSPKGTKEGPAAKATALTVAVNDRTGALDADFNGTGELINPGYGEALLGRVGSTGDGSNGGTASHLYIVYGTAGTHAAAFVDYTVNGGVPDIANPTTWTGTFTVPSDFASMQGFTFDSRGQILVSGDTSSNQEVLTRIGGSRALGHQGPANPPAPRSRPSTRSPFSFRLRAGADRQCAEPCFLGCGHHSASRGG
jgi:hypothetical protein